jgi:hypothetical protein
MKRIIASYLENSLIDEYANKKDRDGYSLEIYDLPKTEIDNFLTFLFEHDEILHERILDRMQELLDAQLPIKECKDKLSKGYIPLQDQSNGEIFWRYRA